MAKQLQLRRGNLSWWTTNNPVLADGEMVLVSTTNDYVYDQYRIGDGLNTFSSLAIHSFPFNTTIEQFLADAEAARDAAQLAETNAETAEANAEAAEALAEKWATNPEDVVVEAGKYSALHWSAKAEDEKLAAEVHKNKAQQWAEAAEDTQVETGKYSAKHWAAKAQASAESIEQSADMLIRHEAEIASLENVINSANINQETTATVTGVDTVALPKTAANTGMQVQLFGQSAENLVVNGDFRNGTTGWTGVRGSISAANNICTLTVKTPSDTSRIQLNGAIPNFIANNKYYAKFYGMPPVETADCRIYVGSAFISPYITAQPNVWNLISGIVTPTANIELGFYIPTTSITVGSQVKYKSAMVINLTATFGAGNEPTKEQCDVLFANYFEGSDNVLGTGRVRSVGKNLFDFNNSIPVQSISGKDYFIINFNANLYDTYNANLTNGVYVNSGGVVKIADVRFQSNNQYTIKAICISGSGGVAYNGLSVFYTDGTSTSSNGTTQLVVSTAGKTIQYVMFTNYGSSGFYGLLEMTSIQIERGTIATTYEPYRESILQLTTPELRSNGLIKDEIRKGTNGYELVKRVGVGTLIEKITNAADRAFSSDTGFWSLSPAYCEITGGNLVFTNTASGLGLTKNGFLTIGKRYKVTLTDVVVTEGYISFGGSLIEAPLILSNTAKIERTSIASATTFFLIGYDNLTCSIGGISIKELDEVDGASIGDNVLTEFDSNVHYTLATQTITPIAHAGLLNSNSNGTAYFEPIIADAGVYASNIAVQLTDYPIASFESIRKYANGTYTELNTATAVIAANGLSFTHPNLAAGDLVMFTYAYNKESIGRSMTFTYPISNSNPYYNVTNSVPLTTGYYTSTTARAAVPEGVRKTGLILTYETAAGVWYTERYIGTATDTTSFTNAANWEVGVLRMASVTDTTEYAEITI